MGRTDWTDEASKKLLVILVEEKEKGITKYQWKNIAKIFNAQTDMNVNQDGKQLINHHSDLKAKFKCWEELQRLSGIAYNPITHEVDVEEKSLERWEAFLQKYPKYGLQLAKKEIANGELLAKLFGGRTAHGVGGCFLTGMAKGPSYLGTTENEIEGSGDSEEDFNTPNDDGFTQLANESQSPPTTVVRKFSVSKKRKSDTQADSDAYKLDSAELNRRQTSFDSVIQLLSGMGPSTSISKYNMIVDELTRMEVEEKRGAEFFVSAVKYLRGENGDAFLALKNDNHKWIYLKEAKVEDD